MSTTLHVVRARTASVALIFRRGPGKQVRQVLWQLNGDRFERGQWLRGRVYPERCDLSPNGKLLVYFAMRRGHTWSAVARPPFFTPLAVWEESGTWGGGGVWVANHALHLRTNPACLTLDPKYTLPPGLDLGCWRGGSLDVVRDGWHIDKARLLKPHPKLAQLFLERVDWDDPGRSPTLPKRPYRYQLHDAKKRTTVDLGPFSWADWDREELVYTYGSQVLRAGMSGRQLEAGRVLVDLANDRFAGMPPPPRALRWPRLS